MKKLITLILILSCTSLIGQTNKGSYAIKNLEMNMLLRPKNVNKSDGTQRVLYSPTNRKCLTWDFINVKENIYQLKNLFTSKTFSPVNGNGDGLIVLKQVPFVKSEKLQQLEFIKVDKDKNLIKLTNTDLYITPKDPQGETNSNVYLRKKLISNLQFWTIYNQNPKI